MGMEMKLEGLTLANVGDGELEERFQEEMRKVGGYAEQLHTYRTSKDGRLVVSVSLDVEFVFGEGSTLVLCDAHAKEPRRKQSVGSVHVNRGRFYNVVEPVQEDLPILGSISAPKREEG